MRDGSTKIGAEPTLENQLSSFTEPQLRFPVDSASFDNKAVKVLSPKKQKDLDRKLAT